MRSKKTFKFSLTVVTLFGSGALEQYCIQIWLNKTGVCSVFQWNSYEFSFEAFERFSFLFSPEKLD